MMFQHQQPLYFSDAYSQPPTSSSYIYSPLPAQQPQQYRRDFDSNQNFSTAPTGLWGPVAGQQQQQQHQQILPSRQIQHHSQPQYNARGIIPKMEAVPDDYEAQQALAGGYAPKLEVRGCGSDSGVCRVVGRQHHSNLSWEYMLTL